MGSKWVWVKLAFIFLVSEGWWSTEAHRQQERLALLQIKHYFNYPPSLQSWVEGDENSDYCLWERVECNSTTGRVISLFLNFINESGLKWRHTNGSFWYLNASLFTPFQELQSLQFQGNYIASCVENQGLERLSTLRNLKLLDLSNNLFNNNVLSSLTGLSSLRTLCLDNNRLKGTIDLKGLDSLTNLEELDISGNAIDKFVARKGGLRKLNSLRLCGLRMKNINMSNLLQWLESFPSLKTLYLCSNDFDGNRTIQEWHNFTNLEELNLDGSSLHTSHLQSITAFGSLKILSMRNCKLNGLSKFQGILNFRNLEHLFMDYTPLDYLKPITKSITSLKRLSLFLCGLKGTILDQGLCELIHLQKLYIQLNHLVGILPSCLANMTSLQILDLSYNQITGDISSSPLEYLTSLQYLQLSDNHFQVPISLAPFYNHSNLNSFYSENNQIYGEVESHSLAPKFQLNYCTLSGPSNGGSFPKFLYHQRNLIEVDISHINLRVEFPNWLLANNTGLNTLRLVNSSLLGPIQMPLHSHMNISVLDISCNHLHGHIPAEIDEYLPRLSELNISRNALNGSIPSSFGNMKSLQSLDSSYNELTGEIPEHLTQGCYKLEFLLLSNNNLQGNIFSKSFNLTNLFRLQLDDNHFSGQIPKILVNCSSLMGLYLSNNHLSGGIPEWFGNLSKLEDIVLPNNNLQGPIPSEFCQLDFLKVLDLSNNNVSGILPSCVHSQNSSIKQIHLSRNKLEGQLEKALILNSSSLVTLDLSHNGLSGSVPNWIDNLSQLSYLIMTNNSLEGELPIQLCLLKELSLLDLSHNDLSGQIPHCLDNTSLHERDFDATTFDLNNYRFFRGTPVGGHSLGEEETVPFTTKSMTYYYQGKILTTMSGVDLSCNKLTGYIPLQIGNLTSIRVLNLSHNMLTGVIPYTFSNLKQIESLDLSYNNLNGKLPSELVKLNYLAVFSVAHNNLSDKVPDRVAQFATFSESSYEGNPFLCGQPLQKSCSESGSPSSLPKISIDNREEDNNLIDMDNFYITFTVSYIIALLGFFVVLYANPYWRRRWFYVVEMWLTSCYYFIVDHLSLRFLHCTFS